MYMCDYFIAACKPAKFCSQLTLKDWKEEDNVQIAAAESVHLEPYIYIYLL